MIFLIIKKKTKNTLLEIDKAIWNCEFLRTGTNRNSNFILFTTGIATETDNIFIFFNQTGIKTEKIV